MIPAPGRLITKSCNKYLDFEILARQEESMKKPAVTLKLRGKPFDPHPLAPSVVRIIKFLDKAPKDELFAGDDIARKIGISFNTIRGTGFTSNENFGPYTEVLGKFRYWGNPAAIKVLRRRIEASQ